MSRLKDGTWCRQIREVYLRSEVYLVTLFGMRDERRSDPRGPCPVNPFSSLLYRTSPSSFPYLDLPVPDSPPVNPSPSSNLFRRKCFWFLFLVLVISTYFTGNVKATEKNVYLHHDDPLTRSWPHSELINVCYTLRSRRLPFPFLCHSHYKSSEEGS